MSQWEQRYVTAQSLGKNSAADGLPQLGVLRDDSHSSVRCAVAIALCSYAPDEQAFEWLVELLADPEAWVRIRSVQSLAAFSSLKAADLLAQHLGKEEDEKVRATMVKVIGSFGDEGLVPVLLPYLEDEDARVRANTIEGLGCIKSQTVRQIIEPFLEDDNSRIRANAARIMSTYAEKVSLSEKTFDGMLGSADQYERAAAIYALGELRHERFLPTLLEMLADKSFVVKRSLVDALVKFGPAIERRLIHRMKSDDPLVRAHCVNILGLVGSAYCLRSIIPLQEDSDGAVRSSAEEALDVLQRRLGTKEGLP